MKLKFTPLEFKTFDDRTPDKEILLLKFTPLEFKTFLSAACGLCSFVKIYSVGV